MRVNAPVLGVLSLASLLSSVQDPPVLIAPQDRAEPDSGILRADRILEDLGGNEVTCGIAQLEARVIRTNQGLELRGEVRNEGEQAIWWRPLVGRTFEADSDSIHTFIACPPQGGWGHPPEDWQQHARLGGGESRRFCVELFQHRFGSPPLWQAVEPPEFWLSQSLDWFLPRSTEPTDYFDFERTQLHVSRAPGREPSLQVGEGKAAYAGRFARTGRIPVQIGPFRGYARLHFRKEGAWLEWELLNRSERAIRFELFRPDAEWRFEQPGTEGDVLSWYPQEDPADHLPQTKTPLGADSRPPEWQSGERRRGRILLRDRCDPTEPRWQLWIPSTWPSSTSLKPERTWLRLHWHQDFGLCLRAGQPWPCWTGDSFYRVLGPGQEQFDERTEIVAIGGWPMMARLSGNGFHLELGLSPPAQDEATWYWGEEAHTEVSTVWVQQPGSATRVPPETLPRTALPGRPLDDEQREDLRMRIDEWLDELASEDLLPTPMNEQLWENPQSHAWEAWTAIPIPRSSPPDYEYDFPIQWISIRFDPEHGLTLAELDF